MYSICTPVQTVADAQPAEPSNHSSLRKLKRGFKFQYFSLYYIFSSSISSSITKNMNKPHILLSSAVLFGALSLNAQTVLLDFGDSVAAATTANGDTWNAMIAPSFMSNLTDTTGSLTTWDFGTVSGSFSENGGGGGGGLSSPSVGLLGNLANADATDDYFYTANTGTASVLRFSDLDDTKTYTLSFFGTRDTAGTRETVYSILDGSPLSSGIVQTSGTGAGSGGTGNDNTLVTFSNIATNGSGKIDFSFGVESGSFGYLGAMSITQIPEPGTYALIGGLYALSFVALRRRRA
jgi:hypothetical protein